MPTVTRALTGREALKQILDMKDLDAPLACVNINSTEDEFDADTSKSSFEIVSFADNTEDGGNGILYFLGEVPPSDDQD